MASRVLTVATLLAVVQLTGCAAFRSYDSELQETNQQLASGNIDAALALLEKHNKGEDKDLLYYFEKGELLRSKGDLTGSQTAWREADNVVFKWEESVKLDTAKYLGQFGSYLVNDKVRRYEGYDYEKVMLTTQMALNLLAVNDFDGARTAIKKTHEREAVIADLRGRDRRELHAFVEIALRQFGECGVGLRRCGGSGRVLRGGGRGRRLTVAAGEGGGEHGDSADYGRMDLAVIHHL